MSIEGTGVVMIYRKYAIIAILAAVLLIFCVPGIAQTSSPVLAPINPEFLNYFKNIGPMMLQEIVSGESLTGHVPEPFVLPKSPVKFGAQAFSASTIPSSYDLRTLGKLTSVKHQEQCGCCWAFAAFGSLESILLPAETWNFSENNLKNTSGYDLGCCEGGNRTMATAYLARWSGAVDESADPYGITNCTSPTGLSPVKHVQDVIYIPDRASSTDNDALKQAVMNYGAVYTTYYESESYYKSTTKGYYYSGTTVGNHAVCIVGWDDNFSRNNFNTPAPGDGAFLIKNSWGTRRDYFYISYYDTMAGQENAVFTAESPWNYSKFYQYDTLGMTGGTGYGSEAGWFANVFTASASDKLSAVSWYSATSGGSYELRVYTNVNVKRNDPTSGTLATTKTGTIANAGYHTYQLSSPVQLTSGQKFSVVVKLTTPGFTYPIPIEQPIANYSSQATANTGESFMSPTSFSWTDVASAYNNTNVCIKAFIAQGAVLSVMPVTNLSVIGAAGGPFQQLTQTYTLTNTGSSSLNWTAGKSQPWSTLSATSGTIAVGGNTSVIVSVNTASAANLAAGSYSDTITFTNSTSGVGNTTRSLNLTVAGNIHSAVEAKSLADGSAITIKNMPITAVFNGFIYVEDPDKSSGIRVSTSEPNLQVGDIITVIGTMASYKPDGVHISERMVQANTVIK